MPETYTPPEVIAAAQEFEKKNEAVDFTKCQMDRVIAAYGKGRKVECESFNPYLGHNNATEGTLRDDLLAEDRTGLAILKLLKTKLPDAKAVSLYDEYNAAPGQVFSDKQRHDFLASIKKRLDSEGVRIDHFIPESSKSATAEELVKILRDNGFLKEKDNGTIYFCDGVSRDAEHFFPLRTKNGKWMCEALDASSFLNEENRKITHLVILPKSFERQQNRVWNILRALGFEPENYHNIFFDPKADTKKVVQAIREEIESAQTHTS